MPDTAPGEAVAHHRGRLQRAQDRLLLKAYKGKSDSRLRAAVAAAAGRLDEHHGSSSGLGAMATHEGRNQQRNTGVWWPCACGSWAWADKKACPKCQTPSPKWCRAYQNVAGPTLHFGEGTRGAAGNAPATIVVGDFVVAGQGKKTQRKARRLAKELSDPQSYRELRQSQDVVPKASDAKPVVLVAADDADMATPNDAAVSAGADLEGRLGEAQAEVARWQTIPVPSRGLVPGFEQHLAEAIAARYAVVR